MVIIQKMQLEDLEAVYTIESLSFTTPWTFESFYNELRSNNLAYYAVVKLEGKVVGYGGLWKVIDEAHITNIAIHPDARGLGLSKKLVAHLADYSRAHQIERMTLEVRVSNHVARHLYEEMGFESLGIRPKYYEDTKEDALILWLSL